jgi:hypothetical protein
MLCFLCCLLFFFWICQRLQTPGRVIPDCLPPIESATSPAYYGSKSYQELFGKAYPDKVALHPPCKSP